MTSQVDENLQETATRLIKALGVEAAIQVCRSNYWHGVLQLVLDQKKRSGDQTDAAILPVQMHCLPNAPYDADEKSPEVDEVAVAA